MKNYFNIFDEKSIPYTLQTCYVGFKSKLLSEENVQKCIDRLLEMDPQNEATYIKIIVDNYSEESLLKALHALHVPIPSEHDESWDHEIRKLRYAYLYDLSLKMQAPSAHERLLEKVALLYADLGYPEDMNHLIYYMPPDADYDPLKHTLEQNRARLVHLLEDFLQKEATELQT
jgi:hypothetical protein